MNTATTDGTELRTIMLRHEPWDDEKVARIRRSLLVNGWEGRPAILGQRRDHHVALTATHRLAASQGLDGIVKAVFLPRDLSAGDWEEIETAFDDEILLERLEQISNRRNDMHHVIVAMKAEIAANNDDDPD